MILLDGTEQEQEGELIPGRKINRYTDRGAAFRKPMAEVEVGDILWDEKRREHWIVQEASYSEESHDGRGASLHISDYPRARTFYESQSYYDSILVLSNPSVLLRYRTEALQREHGLLLESEKPRNAFTIFSDSLIAGDTFLHPRLGWLTVESLNPHAHYGRTGRPAKRSYLITDGTSVSVEEIGSQTKVLRNPDHPDIRDDSISEEDFDRILSRASKNAELTSKELALTRKQQDSTRRPLQGGRPVTLNGISGKAARIFFDELEEGDIIHWPGAGWQTVLSLVVSEATSLRSREVKVATLSNQLRAVPSLETMLVDIFVPDSISKAPQLSRLPGVELSKFQALTSESAEAEISQKPVFVWKSPTAVKDGERVLTVDGWIGVKELGSRESAVYYNEDHWDCTGIDRQLHEVREFKTAKGISLVYAQVRSGDAELSGHRDGPIYYHERLTTTAVVDGDEARTPAGSWLPLVKVEPVMKRRGVIGKPRPTGYIGIFSYPDATQATGHLSVFRDSREELVYEVRRRLSSSDIENLQKGIGA